MAVVDHKQRWGALDRLAPTVVWLTGIPAAGKSTIARLLERELHARSQRAIVLDGDDVRRGLSSDLGFTQEDRTENVRRVAEVARLMTDAGAIVIVALVSPLQAQREMARALLGPRGLIEVFIDTPLEVAEQRDPTGLYRRARAGELPHVTGIDSPYEPPPHPDIHIETVAVSAARAVAVIIEHLEPRALRATPPPPDCAPPPDWRGISAAHARSRFAGARVARLATATADGRPHIVPIVFACSGDRIYSVVDAKPKRSTALKRIANVRENSSVSVLADYYDDTDWSALWWVRADGCGRILESERDEARHALGLLRERYPQQRAIGDVLAVDVERWSGWTAR